MTTHPRTLAAGLLLACGVLAVSVGVARYDDSDPADTTAPAAPSKGPYVALGDSYTAGPMIPDQTGDPAGCARSDRNYPALVAQDLGLKGSDFRDVSCTGATLADLTTRQPTRDGTNPPQLAALDTDTRLVTIGIGGNDIGFGSMIERCVGAGLLYKALGGDTYGKALGGDTNKPADAPCKRHYVNGGTDDVRQRIQQAGDRLARTLTEVRHRAPEARVYVVGYPAILPAGSAECGDEMSLAPGDIDYLREKEQQLNAMLRQRAEEAGMSYVDTCTPSEGRGACSAKDTRWIEPLIPNSPAAAVHPNERGERGMADAVLRAVRTSSESNTRQGKQGK